MNRPTAAERRLDYLDLGLDMLREFELDEPAEVSALADIRVSDVARRAGVSKGALYHIWPSQESYRQDLLQFLLDEREEDGVRHTLRLLDELTADEPVGPRLLRRGAATAFEQVRGNHRYLARFGFALYASHPDVQPLLGRAVRIEVDTFSPVVERAVDLLGRQPRQPFTIGYLTTALTTLLDGYVVQSRLTPGLLPERVLVDEHGEWSAFGTACLAVIEHFTEPASA